MEVRGEVTSRRSGHKRKVSEMEDSAFPLDELNQDVLERVLAWLPTASFCRLKAVCKRWKSAVDSAAFKHACADVPRRDPWFLMVDSRLQLAHQSVIFDSSENNWKKLNLPALLRNQNSGGDYIPVAASGGLICFRGPDGDFLVTNPINSSSRRINSPFPQKGTLIRAIAMSSKSNSFNLIVISGDLPNLKFRRFNSISDDWEPEIALTRKSSGDASTESSDDCTQYFLTKCGNVVSTDIQRSPAKQYSSVLTVKNGDNVLSYISSSGTVVSCNLTRKLFSEYPRLLPVFSEYSIDLVECGGQMYVVLLSEFLESSSLRVWTWDEGVQFWRQAAAMPPSMAHKFYGRKVDINCAAAGGQMLVCLSSAEVCSYVMCDLGANEWVELGSFCDEGNVRELVCGLCFEPRIEASVWGSHGRDLVGRSV